MAWIDRISETAGKLAAWLFFVIAVMITWEVVSRYLFLAPTIWAEEMSQFFQIWATYLAAAYVLKHRQLITIDAVVLLMPWRVRWCMNLIALLVIVIFCTVAIYYGIEILLESIRVGRATSTMLSVPKWMTESAIPVGFSILLLQAFAEILRLFKSPGKPLEEEQEPGV